MSKRMWIMTLIIATLSVILAACSGGDLAEDLTPIPTLPPGQTPTLIASLPVAATEEVAASGDNSGEQIAATEAMSAEGTAEAGMEGTAEAGSTGNGGSEGDPAVGEALFTANCAGCHGEEAGAGPPRVGLGERAATSVEGLSAAEYIHQSIVDPSAHVVEGFSDIMPKDYAEKFDDDQINGLVAYLLQQ